MVPSEPLGGAMPPPPWIRPWRQSRFEHNAGLRNKCQKCPVLFNVRKVGNIFIFFLLELAACLRLDIDFGLITWDSEDFGAFLGVV